MGENLVTGEKVGRRSGIMLNRKRDTLKAGKKKGWY